MHTDHEAEPAEGSALGMTALLTALRAAAEPTRLRILALCMQGDLTVTDLTRLLGQSQPRVSRHLKLLCEAGLLERYQEGTWAFFHLPPTGPMRDLVKSVMARIDGDDEVLNRDSRRLQGIRAAHTEQANHYFRDNADAWDHIRSLHVDESEVEAAMLEMLPSGGVQNLLDIGTGTARMLQLYAPYAEAALGIDRSREMLAVARTRLGASEYRNCTVRQADMTRLPLDDDAFDLVVLHMVLHYADRPADVIAEAARVLAPGGRFVIADFAPHEMEELRDAHAHRRLGFRGEDIASWCAENGLDVAEERRLDGDPLTVMLWLAQPTASIVALAKPETRQDTGRARR